MEYIGKKFQNVIFYMHSLATLLDTPCQPWVKPYFAFRTILILLSTEGSKPSAETECQTQSSDPPSVWHSMLS